MSAEQAYLAQFAQGRAALPGAALPWLDALRGRAIERFAAHGFPTQRLEDWKFTGLGALAREPFAPGAARAEVPAAVLGATRLEGRSHRLVFVNGRFRPDLSDLCRLPGNVAIENLADALRTEPELLEGRIEDEAARAGSLISLNTALAQDGAVIRLGRGAALDWPVHLVFVGESGAAQLRNLVLAEAGAIATVLETYVAANGGAYWTNAVTDIVAGEGAAIGHHRLQAESEAAFHVAVTRARLARNAALTSLTLALGGQIARNEIHARFEGEGGHAKLCGAYLARGRQHTDQTVRLDHASPRCASTQIFKGVLDERAHGVFQGRIRVAPQAQQTDAQQLNRSLLLADGAQADTKPELEILADDVKCSHGATVGDLDRDALFYLRARGVGERAARALLVEGFVGELLDQIEARPLRAAFGRAFTGWLAEMHHARG